MSWLLFMDESGHDHKQMPYEVRGGFALHARHLWPFIEAAIGLEQDCFGGRLSEWGHEVKGSKLLDSKRIGFACQEPPQVPEERRANCRRFLTKRLEGKAPVRAEFSAYGQACLEMARGAFRLLAQHEARVFASMIPRGVRPPRDYHASEFLRKDHVFLLERYFYFLESVQEHGLLVMDTVEKQADQGFLGQMRKYFTETQTGRQRAHWVIPAPLFVDSEVAYPVQVADLCIYVINKGYRVGRGMTAEKIPKLQTEFESLLQGLQYQGHGYRDGRVYQSYGIFLVPDPYTPRVFVV